MVVQKIVTRLESALASLVGRAVAFDHVRMVNSAQDVVTARYRGALVIAPIFLVACIPLLLPAAVSLNTWQLDYSLPLDTSMRWVYGHVPHIDFETPIGAAYWLVQGWATALIGVDVRTPVLANIIAAVPLVAGAAFLLGRRLSGGLLGILLLAVFLLTISPRAPGDLPGEFSFLAAYNGVGNAIFCVLITTLFLQPARPRRAGALAAEAGVLAFFLLWLIYLKITFAVISVAGGIVALHYAPENRKTILLAAALLIPAVLVVGWSTGINGPYLDDISDAARAGTAFRFKKLLLDITSSRLSLALIGLCMVFYWTLSASQRSEKVSNLVVALGLLVAGAVAMNQAHNNYLPLGFASLIVLAQRALSNEPERDPKNSPVRKMASYVPPLMGAILLVGLVTLSDVFTVAHYFRAGHESAIRTRMCDHPDQPVCDLTYVFPGSAFGARFSPLPGPRFAGDSGSAAHPGPLSSLVEIIEFCSANEICFLWKLNEQLIHLLNRHMTPDDRPYFFGFTNILPYYYQVEPPKHVMAWSGVDRNFSQASHPSPAHMFSDITVLVLPKVKFGSGMEPGLHPIYEDELPAYFSKVDETEAWSIWRRPDTRSPTNQ